MHLRWMVFLFFSLLGFTATGQGTVLRRDLTSDTIVIKKDFLGKTYLLDGKSLSLEVMDFFMAGHLSAQGQVRTAIVTDQLSLVCYGAGGILLLGGILLGENNAQSSRHFMVYGSIGLASGLVFQIISNSHQSAAVRFYNADIRTASRQMPPGQVYIRILGNGVGLGACF